MNTISALLNVREHISTTLLNSIHYKDSDLNANPITDKSIKLYKELLDIVSK